MPDPTGPATMSPAMKGATRYAGYLYDCVRPWLAAPVLEVGVGFGTYTELLLRHGRVVGLDVDEGCVREARRRFGAGRPFEAVRLDLNDHAGVRRLEAHSL